MSGIAQAIILDFDNIPGVSVQNTYNSMPLHEGFLFSSTLDCIDVVGSGWNFGAHSGDFALLNNHGGIGTIRKADGTDFTFDGLWVKRWGTVPDSGGAYLSGTLSGYNNGSLVWSTGTAINGTYRYYAAQTGAIDELRMGFGNYFIADDIALDGGMSATVPVPATLILLGIGLLGLSGTSRRKK